MGLMKKILLMVLAASLSFLFSCRDSILGPDPPNTPAASFEFLWKEFDRYYPLFGIKNIDWNKVHDRYRAEITDSTTDSELWNIVTEMLGELNDPHISLAQKSTGKIFVSGSIQPGNMTDFSLNNVLFNYLGGNYEVDKERIIYWGKFPRLSIGYLYIATFAGPEDGWAGRIDSVLDQIDSLGAVIVDLRGNGGGRSQNLDYIVSSFIDRKITYAKMTYRSGPGLQDFAPLQDMSIEPRPGGARFTGSVVLLTNRYSASASDYFNWILKEYMPNVTTIGDTTTGVFGAKTDYKTLPNGWLLSFSGTLVYSMNGIPLDSLGGIAPDVLVLNNPEEVILGKDSVLEYAIHTLEADPKARPAIRHPAAP